MYIWGAKSTRGRRAFGGAEALDDPVELDTVAGGEEVLGQPPVFGCNGQAAAVAGAEVGSDIAEIGHGVDILPDVRDGDNDIGMTETEPRGNLHPLISAGQTFANQILTGDAEIHSASAEFARNLGG